MHLEERHFNSKISFQWNVPFDEYLFDEKGHVIRGALLNNRLANIFLNRMGLITHSQSGRIYTWNGTYYESVFMEQRIKDKIVDILNDCGKGYTLAIGNTVLEIIRNTTIVDSEKFNRYPEIIPFRNGWYNVKEGKFEDPDSNKFISYCIPHEYDPKAKYPQFRKFMKQVLPDKRDRELVFKFFAYILTPSVELQKAMMFYGTGNNGKTILCEILQYILGDDLFSNIALQQLGDRFNRALYFAKLANISNELSSVAMSDDSYFKSMVTETKLPGEIKGKTPFKYYNTCRILCACNLIPRALEQSGIGFYRRWIIIPFLIDFTEVMDEKLLKRLKKETKGIIAYIMSFLPKIGDLKNVTVAETKDKWQKYGDSTTRFIYRCIGDSPKNIDTTILYGLYKKWCAFHHLTVVGVKVFSKIFGKSGYTKKKVPRKLYYGSDQTVISWKYENIYPQFTEEEEDAIDIIKDKNGDYIFGIENEELVIDYDFPEPKSIVFNNEGELVEK